MNTDMGFRGLTVRPRGGPEAVSGKSLGMSALKGLHIGGWFNPWEEPGERSWVPIPTPYDMTETLVVGRLPREAGQGWGSGGETETHSHARNHSCPHSGPGDALLMESGNKLRMFGKVVEMWVLIRK